MIFFILMKVFMRILIIFVFLLSIIIISFKIFNDDTLDIVDECCNCFLLECATLSQFHLSVSNSIALKFKLQWIIKLMRQLCVFRFFFVFQSFHLFLAILCDLGKTYLSYHMIAWYHGYLSHVF